MRKKFSDFVKEDGEGGGIPANNAGTGNIAGIGVGPKGEPGVDLRKKRKQFDEGQPARIHNTDSKMPMPQQTAILKKIQADKLKKEDGVTVTNEATETEIEAAAKAVHDQWMEKQKELGHDEHKSPDGSEDYMVPFHKLSDDAKELDRLAVKAVVATLGESTEGLYVKWSPIPRRPWGVHYPDGRVLRRFDTVEDATAFLKKQINEDHDTFAGARVFEVDMERVMGSRFGKHPRHRYSKYVGEDETGEAIRQHGRDRKSGDIILKDATTAVMTYLRRKPAKA